MQPTTVLGLVPLVPAKGAYKELQLGDALRMLIPHPPLFPLSLMHVPVFLECERAKTITAVVIRYVTFNNTKTKPTVLLLQRRVLCYEIKPHFHG